MSIDLSLNDFSLPIYVKWDRDYYGHIKKIFYKYTEHIKKISGLSQECKDKISENCELILKSILLKLPTLKMGLVP